ncbi:hypothetical protein PIIN_05188 [Serendipita indica DSM 11827]|uniref:DUF7330 domain-containing protein n=1 Tax=Serendipita indica (strain DSM 11827) TaxID=1109443 RepID=G4TIV6_SERID|nr:hypothetical protein PIIN_05188 [Serendipita indica DSM 11827]
MIDQEKPLDMDTKLAPVSDEPPPYSRRQASTSSHHNRLQSTRQPPTPQQQRFVAPVSHESSSIPSPRLVVSPATNSNAPYSHGGYEAQSSFTDLATDKRESMQGGPYAEYGYTGPDVKNVSPMPTGAYSPGQESMSESTYSVPGSSSGPGHLGVGPRSPTTASRKGTETVILLGTGHSGMWLNHVVIATKEKLIQGAYHVDPNLDIPDHATPRRIALLPKKSHARSTSSLSQASSKSGKKKADPSWHPTAVAEACNALFETKTAGVDILLSIGGSGDNRSNRANIDVRTKNGKAAVKVVEIGPERRVNLDILTAKGDIEVFIPRKFSGPLHMHTDGEITLLPRLASSMEVISAREDDALVMIKSNSKPLPPSPTGSSSRQNQSMPGGFSNWLHPHSTGASRSPSYEGDFCNLVSSGGGNIIVGFVGEDKIQEESPGIWKKFVSLLTGRSNSA